MAHDGGGYRDWVNGGQPEPSDLRVVLSVAAAMAAIVLAYAAAAAWFVVAWRYFF